MSPHGIILMNAPMTETIAVRTFWWANEPERQVSVLIGKPILAADGNGEFYCPIRTVGLGNDEYVQPIFGVDAFQAIELAMRYVEHRISDIDAKSGGQLRWQFGHDKRIPAEWAQQAG